MLEQRVKILLVLIVASLFAGLLYVLAFHELPDKNREILLTLAGVVATAFSTLVSSYFHTATPGAPALPAAPNGNGGHA